MEANFFRFLAREIGPVLKGRRIEKIFMPGEHTWTIRLDGSEPRNLLIRPAKSAGLLFLSDEKPQNPMNPPARVMWFRKRISGRRIDSFHTHWPSLTLALELTPTNRPDAGRFMIIDLRLGLDLVDDLPDDFEKEPDWPTLETALSDAEVWREFPQISPALRKKFDSDPINSEKLLHDLAFSQVTTFHVPIKSGSPLPPLCWSVSGNMETFASALEASNFAGERILFPNLEMSEIKDDRRILKRETKKIRRALANLEKERERMNSLVDLKLKAEALQAQLYMFPEMPETDSVTVEHHEAGSLTVELNTRMTMAENMQSLFRLAAKGQRGLDHAIRRERLLLKELEDIKEGKLPQTDYAVANKKNSNVTLTLPKKFRGLAVSLFRTSDGFLVARGKNKSANHKLSGQAANPFDYWFHVADGPGSHVILKRDNPSAEVPEQSLREAATLAGLKSYRSRDGRADVLCAKVKDIRRIKGANLGMVAIDKVWQTLRVDLDPEIESRLKWLPAKN